MPVHQMKVDVAIEFVVSLPGKLLVTEVALCSATCVSPELCIALAEEGREATGND